VMAGQEFDGHEKRLPPPSSLRDSARRKNMKELP
jgi:hypothetical protein